MVRREYPDSPKVGVGAVVIRDGKVLLVRRGVPPSMGLWAIPGGGLKLGETLREGAEREVFEETGIRIKAKDIIYTGESVHRDEAGRVRFHYVLVDFAADYLAGEVNGSDDALEARWFSPSELEGIPATKSTMTLLTELGFSPSPERGEEKEG